MMQFFQWYHPNDGSLWNEVHDQAEYLASLGIDAVWLPPAYKGVEGGSSSGYDTYDLFDLGEFDQKGSVRTKYGTREEFIRAAQKLQACQIQVYADVVLNHKGGADECERIKVRKVDPEDRTKFTSEPFDIDAFTKFTFPGRKGQYSAFIWDQTCFSGTDYASDLKETAIFSIQNEYGEGWEEVIDTEKGNYDFLMMADVELRNPAVREELKYWGEWYLQQAPIAGFRLDAVKHMSPQFYIEWLDHLRNIKPDLFAVGEYWAPGELHLLLRYIEVTEGRMSLFDAALHHRFYDASRAGSAFDLSTILNDSLVSVRPELAVTVVDNHDTQPLQSLEAPVEAWFKPHAYALILLREGGYPCIFYPDLYGAHYTDKDRTGQEQEVWLEKCASLEKLLVARKSYNYGQQRDYFDHPNCIGWTREGDESHPVGCAVVMSTGDEGFKRMELGKIHAGKTLKDFLGHCSEEITVEETGWATFAVNATSVSVWTEI
ncbi:MAG: alpha-amylase [Chitinophagaceae bacterium]|nr:alpha-amylase [Chitinophagaceae bacterium]